MTPRQRTRVNLSRAFLKSVFALLVLASTHPYVNFRRHTYTQSNKFDDQCADFGQHETLDASGALLTATVDNVTGDISGLSLSSSDTAGVIPFTVPSGSTVRRPPAEFVFVK